MGKKILYIDLDGVVADFSGYINQVYPGLDMTDYEVNGPIVDAYCIANRDVFHNLLPITGAVDAVKKLFSLFDVYFLSTPMWDVPSSWEGKRVWVEKYFGEDIKKRLILTHRKDLNLGDYLIDDRTKNGAADFKGELILFGSEKYPSWGSVINYLIQKK